MHVCIISCKWSGGCLLDSRGKTHYVGYRWWLHCQLQIVHAVTGAHERKVYLQETCISFVTLDPFEYCSLHDTCICTNFRVFWWGADLFISSYWTPLYKVSMWSENPCFSQWFEAHLQEECPMQNRAHP
jgi:hypothetical protein